MTDTASAKVFSGSVLEWHSEEGWGVLVSHAFPDRVWAHHSAVQAEGCRELTAGQNVTFSAEQAEQDEYRRRAVSIWPETGARRSPNEDEGPGFSSVLNITFAS